MKRIPILMYHQVGRFPAMKQHRATYCDLDRFRRQMKWLGLAGYRVIRLDEAVTALRENSRLDEKNVVLTFDDAYENFYENAFPILTEMGYPATLYVIAGMIGKRADWLATDGHDAARLMDAAQLREVQTSGITIGSHSFHHIHLAEQDRQTIAAETADSKAALEDLLGTAVEDFCYPYGSHDRRCVEAVKAAGYATATTCQRAAATARFDPHALPRKAISFGDTLPGYWWKLVGKNKPKQPPIVFEPIGGGV